MRKFLLITCLLILSGVTFGQLTGVKNIPGSGGPNDYPTLAAAIADLNLYGTGPGGVTFDIAAGYTETFLTPNAGLIIATGTQSSPIVFQKSGSGTNPLITAAAGTTTTTDGIIKIAGGDYITFDGIDLTENAVNTNVTTQMEWGYAMVKARNAVPVDGCQYITIKNCTVTLNAGNLASVCIYSGNHLANSTTAITAANIQGSSDLMNNCRFFGNNLSNACAGFKLSGYNDPNQVLFDQNNEIGIQGAGNIITNIGSLSNLSYCIYADKQINLKIAYNTMTGGNTSGNYEGITPRTTNSCEIHHNTISIGNSSGTSSIYAIDVYAAGMAGYTVEVHDNLITNCFNYGSGSLTAISGGTGAASVLNIFNNTISNNTVAVGTMSLLDGGAATINNIYGNQIFNNTKTGPGTMTCMRSTYFGVNIHDNLIYSNNINTSGVVTGSSILSGIGSNSNGQTSELLYNNMVYDLNITGSNTSTSNTVTGISSDLAGGNRNWYNNVVKNLSITGPAASGTVYGFRLTNGVTTNMYKNQVYNLSAANAAGVVNGITISSGTQVNVYNNFISDLRAPGSASTVALSGILVAGATNAGLYYNTIFLNGTSSSPIFGTSGIYKTGTTTMLDLRNNLILNNSDAGSTGGVTAAMRWSAAFNPTYYSGLSTGNNFWAGTSAVNHLIFYDGINSDLTMATYQVRVSPRDGCSFSENTTLVNSTVSPYDLHVDATIPTQCEQGGVAMITPSITVDIDGNPRGSVPDVGADEFNGINPSVINPINVTASGINSKQTQVQYQLNPSGNQVVVVWNLTGYFSSPSGPLPVVNSSFAGGTVLSAGTSLLVNHSGLTGGTTYFYKAFSYNGSAYSSGVATSASTAITPPTGLIGYAVSTNEIDLYWNKNAAGNDVIVAWNTTATFGQPVNGTAYTAGNTLPTGGTILYAGPAANFIHSGLTTNTKYYYKAWSVDSYSFYSATGAAANSTTMLCGPSSTIPFTEGFESYTVPAVGCGMVIDANADGVAWVTTTTTSPAPHGGTKQLTLASSTIPSDDWFIIQGLNLTGGTTYQVSFWYRPQYTSSAERFEVKWGTAPTPMAMYDPALKTIQVDPLSAVYKQATVYVTPVSSGTYYFGWHAISAANLYSLFLDDISVTGNSCAAPPAITVTGTTSNSVNLGWTGTAPNVQFDYGTVGHVAGAGTLISTSVNPYTHSGLTPMTSYDVYVRQDCGSGAYSYWTGPVTFTTAYLAPAITTEAATLVSSSTATINGTVNANGVVTSLWFEYGLTTAYGNSIVGSPASSSGTSASAFSAALTGLAAGGYTYHYRAAGISGGQIVYGPDLTFTTTASAPTVNTLAVTGQTATGAVLNGTVNANNSLSSVLFDYGTTSGVYTDSVAGTPSSVAGVLPVPVSASLSGLTNGTQYFYRVRAANGNGTTNGTEMSFYAGDLPVAVTNAATTTTTNGNVTLNGTVNGNGFSTTVTFQYGLTTTYGTIVTATQSPVTGNSPTAVSFAVTGLSMNTLYHYRVVAVSSTGTTNGADQTFTTGTLPTVSTSAATLLATGVTLNGTVSWNNATTVASYDYGTTTSYGSSLQYTFNPVITNSKSIATAIPSGLTPGTLYHFRAVGTNMGGTAYGNDFTFTTPVAPTVTTLAATNITAVGAKLNGTVVTNAATATNFRYEYGLTTSYGTVASPSPASGSTNATFSPTVTLSTLLPGTTYHYRVYASNAAGIFTGADMTFTTLSAAPTVTTVAAGLATPFSATLNGTVNANNAATTAGFDYGLTTSYGLTAVATPSSLIGTTATPTYASVSGLIPNSLYHYRANATNATGTTNGSDATFTTLPELPLVATSAATDVMVNSATLNGSVNANNASSTVWFEYGLTAAYGSQMTPAQSPVTGTVTTVVNIALTGLTSFTTYHYRVVSTNSAGTSYGADMTFLTLPDPLVLNGTPTNVTGCYGNSNGSISTTVGGGVPPYTYLWSNLATTSDITGVPSGTYTVHVTDSYNDTISGTWTLGQPEQLVVSGTTIAAGCPTEANGSIDVTSTGGTSPYQFLWSNSATTEDISGLLTGTYIITVTDLNGCTNIQSYFVDAGQVCTNISVSGIITSHVCYNALSTILVSEAPETFKVMAGGEANFIAGEKIIFLPGTKIAKGGKMTAVISPGGPWCPSLPAAPEFNTGNGGETAATESTSFTLFPNPTRANFTIVQKGTGQPRIMTVEIYSMNGSRVLSQNIIGEMQHEFSFEAVPNGIYFVKIMTENNVETIKLVKTR